MLNSHLSVKNNISTTLLHLPLLTVRYSRHPDPMPCTRNRRSFGRCWHTAVLCCPFTLFSSSLIPCPYLWHCFQDSLTHVCPPRQHHPQHRTGEANLDHEEADHTLPSGTGTGGEAGAGAAATTTTAAVEAGALSEEQATFESLGLCDWLLTACKAMGFRQPTPVQRHCIPAVSASRRHGCFGF